MPDRDYAQRPQRSRLEGDGHMTTKANTAQEHCPPAATGPFPEPDRRERNQAALRLLRSWQAQDPTYDEETMAELRVALDAHRESPRKLFP